MHSETILPLLLGCFDILIVVILLMSYKSNKHVNIYLIIIMLCGAVKLLHTGFTTDESDIISLKSFLYVRPIILLGVAAMYLYIKSLVNDEKRVRPHALYHTIVPIVWSLLFFVPSIYASITEDTWFSIRKLFIVSYVFFYIALTLIFLKDYYNKNNHNLTNATHFNSIKKWVGIFVAFVIIIILRALVHFCFEIEENGGLLSEASFTIKIGLFFLVLLKILTTPEILFGYSKLKKSLSHDSETHAENVILKINNEFYLKDKPIKDYFEGKNLDCLLLILDCGSEFVNLNILDDNFVSENKASLRTVKKRREQSIKEIKLLLSFRLDTNVDSIFIESRDEIDKRIKLIKINPELLSIYSTSQK